MQSGLFPCYYAPNTMFIGSCFGLGLMNQMQATSEQIRTFQNSQLTNTLPGYIYEQYTQSITQCCCNIPLSAEVCQCKPKKKTTIEELDRLIFPNDPIRNWMENEIERISRKYAQILEEY